MARRKSTDTDTPTTGHNSVSAQELRSFVDRIERINAEIKELQEDRKVVFAEMKAGGFDLKVSRAVLKIRAKEDGVNAYEQGKALVETYLSALGMAEAPLFKAVGAMQVDRHAREEVIQAFKALVPDAGEIIIRAFGAPVRLWRDKDGIAHAEDYQEPEPEAPPPAGPARPARRKATPALPPEIAALTPEEADAAGEEAAERGEAVITNPFPHDDARRPRWDAGWRRGDGGDGMGPSEDD